MGGKADAILARYVMRTGGARTKEVEVSEPFGQLPAAPKGGTDSPTLDRCAFGPGRGKPRIP